MSHVDSGRHLRDTFCISACRIFRIVAGLNIAITSIAHLNRPHLCETSTGTKRINRCPFYKIIGIHVVNEERCFARIQKQRIVTADPARSCCCCCLVVATPLHTHANTKRVKELSGLVMHSNSGLPRNVV